MFVIISAKCVNKNEEMKHAKVFTWRFKLRDEIQYMELNNTGYKCLRKALTKWLPDDDWVIQGGFRTEPIEKGSIDEVDLDLSYI